MALTKEHKESIKSLLHVAADNEEKIRFMVRQMKGEIVELNLSAGTVTIRFPGSKKLLFLKRG
jgi:hypothetical protein